MPGMPRQLRTIQGAAGKDDEARADAITAIGLDQPASLLLLPFHARDDSLKQCPPIETEVTADAARMFVDLGSPRIFAHRHVAGLFQQRQVDVALGIAGRTGVAIPVPGAAEIGGLFNDPEIIDAGRAQSRAAKQAAEATAHDEHLGLFADSLARKSGIGPGIVEIAPELAGHLDILRLALGAQAAIALVTIACTECGNVDCRFVGCTSLVSFR
ncbi:hypothetical protein ACVWWK_006224 [Bradyrhizobium sp. LB9.1b]